MIHLIPIANSWFPGERSLKKPLHKSLSILLGGIGIVLLSLILIIFAWCRVGFIQTSRPVKKNVIARLIGKSMFNINEQAVSQYLSQQDPTIQSVAVVRKFPQTLILKIVEDIPIAQINNNSNFVQIDFTGKIIRVVKDNNSELASITYFQNLRNFEAKPGTRLTQIEIVKALEIAYYRKQLLLPLQRISIPEPQRIILTFIDSPLTVLLTTKKDIAKNIFILHNIMKGLDKKGIRPSVINLEFDKPVVTL